MDRVREVFHVEHRFRQDLDEVLYDASKWKLEIDAPMQEKILQFVHLISEWQQKVHLVSSGDIPRLIGRHVRESLALSSIPEVRNARSVLDIGAGAGFPSVPLHLVHQFKNTTAVESNHKKSLFLDHVRQELGMHNYHILNARLETMPDMVKNEKPARYQTIFMRAVGKLVPNLKIAMGLLDLSSGQGQILVPRGRFEMERPREILPKLVMSSYYVSLGESLQMQAEHRKGMEVLVFTSKA